MGTGYGDWVGTGWVLGRVIPGSTQPPRTYSQGRPRQRSGPRKPYRGWSGWSGLTVPVRPHPPFGPGPGPLVHSLVLLEQIAASWPIRRDLTSILGNLVKTAECHQNITKRPVIVPVSHLGLKSHLLKFSDFHFCGPSLTRN